MDFLFLLEGWFRVDKRMLSPQGRALGRDSYDNCLAYLDDRLGELFNELERLGVLEETLVIVTADHGEGLGEHDLFDHGESLYHPEIRVPLVIVPPKGMRRSQAVVEETVSLRDLPATIAELATPGSKMPFPGVSLSRFWREPEASAGDFEVADDVMSELAAPNPIDPNQGRSPARRGALVSLTEGDFVYIRNQGDGGEELFDVRNDPRELTNLLQNRSRSAAVLPVVRRFRARLDQVMSHP
jgi:arylsulfatase A-like enzyme